MPSSDIPPPAYSDTTPRSHGNGMQSKNRTCIQITAALHVCFGALLVVFGVVNIIIWAWWSYLATPIWTGIVIFKMAGFAGFWASSTQTRVATITYIVMSSLALATSIAISILYGFAATNEGKYSGLGGYYSVCHPGLDDVYIINCAKSEAARITFDALIAATGFAELIVSILSLCYAGSFICSSNSHQQTITAAGTSNANGIPQSAVSYPAHGQPAAVFIIQQPGQSYPGPGPHYPGPEARVALTHQGYVTASPGGNQLAAPYGFASASAPQPSPLLTPAAASHTLSTQQNATASSTLEKADMQ